MDEDLVEKLDEVYIRIDSNEFFILKELVEYFTFKVPGAEFMPSYKNKMWDGRIRLLNPNNRKLYKGLLPQLKRFCDLNNYTFVYENIQPPNFTDDNLKELVEYIKPQSSGKSISYRDYQLDAVKHAINTQRCLLLSPTASGKSLIIYTLLRFYSLHPELENKKLLIIVPTTSLVHQMYSDFEDYGYNSEKYCHKIYSGQDKNTHKRIVISTWQSIFRLDKEYFDQFGLVIGDECHLFKANSLNKIMDRMVNCKYRFGTTGTLDGTKTHKLMLTGMFGDVKQVTSTKKLIDNKTLAEFKIKALVLKYTDEQRKENKKENEGSGRKYADEIFWLIHNERRNRFINNLTLSLKGNTLVLYQRVEQHGKPMFEDISKRAEEGRPVFFVSGEIKGEVREEIRALTEKSDNAIIVASYGTFSTGINIKNLHNVVFSSPTKSRIRNLQSIGRGLRRGDAKESAVLYDIGDDLRHKTYINFAMRHFFERINIYNEEKFDFQVHDVQLYKGV